MLFLKQQDLLIGAIPKTRRRYSPAEKNQKSVKSTQVANDERGRVTFHLQAPPVASLCMF